MNPHKESGRVCVAGLTSAELVRLIAGLQAAYRKFPYKTKRLLRKCFRSARKHPRNGVEFGKLVIVLLNCIGATGKAMPFNHLKSGDRLGERWSHAEELFLIKNYPWLAVEVIAACLGRTVYSVHGKAKALGLRRTQYSGSKADWKIWTPAQERRLVRLRKKGKSFAQIARSMQRTLNSVEGKYHKIMRLRAQKKRAARR
ncbi:MAG: hypothetical protein PHY34_03485 [Patescibacteria group bacterium]|nr:hypothetical protein [Patescibacteria group bacterium]MDD5715655.1 hypothetical protein [Patescibacteria group bacterium]